MSEGAESVVRTRSRRATVEIAVLLVLVIAAGVLLWARLRPDPYAPGTSHPYTLVRTAPSGCPAPDPVELDGRRWRATGPGSHPWAEWSFPLAGTFHIEDGGRATFDADEGGTIPFQGGRRFVDAVCSLS